ncbi:cobalt ECF transporter T component CbiQ [Cohnella cholangitidis]|uniref:Cobalt ECF transporter T component CbiQ n=1 Tax=Cohnella cholangitidis TaxID=2598458 RepID=A0A7G5BYE3_9BACL|nr:cobalt ECF transporter T component CbiQ [Cohnella cholangitidis]QMV41977.1 cobalt ECF transporter T component CbiQ [Cohnella cholangitidis]
MLKLIDSLSYGNALRAASPLWKCGFAAILFLLAYVSQPPVQLLIVAWMLFWIIGHAKIPAVHGLLLLGGSCLFFLASLPALVLDLQMGSIALSEKGIASAGFLFCRMLACLSVMFFLILTTPFQQLLQVMAKLRIPSLVLELMLITYRFLFLFMDTAHDMYVAQKARGGHYGFKNKLNDMAILIVRLFVKTMHRYKGLSNGLISRGFTDEIRMAPYEAEPVTYRYRLETGIGLTILLLAECWLRWREYQ